MPDSDEKSEMKDQILQAFKKQEETIRKLRSELASLQKAKREHVRLPEESEFDEDVSEMMDVNLRVQKNQKKHKTSSFSTKKSNSKNAIIGRRGEEIVIEVTSEQGLNLMESKLDSISLHIFEAHPNKPDVFSNTACSILSSASDSQLVSMSIIRGKSSDPTSTMSLTGNTSGVGFLRFTARSNFPIGKYRIRIVGESVKKGTEVAEGDKKEDGTTAESEQVVTKYKLCEFDLHLLFNPFNIKDETYLEDESDLEEFVLRDHGVISCGYTSKHWFFGQFEETSLLALLSLLKACPFDDRRSPKTVARFLASQVDVYAVAQLQRKSRVVETSLPYSLNGSDDILAAYQENETSLGAKQEGSSNDFWVGRTMSAFLANPSFLFSGVLVTLLRCSGIPTRALSVLDTPGRLALHQTMLGGVCSVDVLFAQSGQPIVVNGGIGGVAVNTQGSIVNSPDGPGGSSYSNNLDQTVSYANKVRSKRVDHHCLCDIYVDKKWHLLDCAGGLPMGPLNSDQIFSYKSVLSISAAKKVAADENDSSTVATSSNSNSNSNSNSSLNAGKFMLDQQYFRRLLFGDIRYFHEPKDAESHEWNLINFEPRAIGERVHTSSNDIGLPVNIRQDYAPKALLGGLNGGNSNGIDSEEDKNNNMNNNNKGGGLTKRPTYGDSLVSDGAKSMPASMMFKDTDGNNIAKGRPSSGGVVIAKQPTLATNLIKNSTIASASSELDECLNEFRDVDYRVPRSMCDKDFSYMFSCSRVQDGAGKPIKAIFEVCGASYTEEVPITPAAVEKRASEKGTGSAPLASKSADSPADSDSKTIEKTTETITKYKVLTKPLKVVISALIPYHTEALGFLGGARANNSAGTVNAEGVLQGGPGVGVTCLQSTILCRYSDWAIPQNPSVSYEVPEKYQLRALSKGLRFIEVQVLAFRTDSYVAPNSKSLGVLKAMTTPRVKLNNNNNNMNDEDNDSNGLGVEAINDGVSSPNVYDSVAVFPQLDDSQQLAPVYATSRFVELKLPRLELDFESTESGSGAGDDSSETNTITVNLTNPYTSTGTALTNCNLTLCMNSSGWLFEKNDTRHLVIENVKSTSSTSNDGKDSSEAGVIKAGETLKLSIPVKKPSVYGEVPDGFVVATLDAAEFGGRNGTNGSLRFSA